MDMIPAIRVEMERIVEVRLTAKPVCWRSVLKIRPIDSPAETMAMELSVRMPYIWAVRGMPVAKVGPRAKRSEQRIMRGVSMEEYEAKKAVVE